LPERLRGGWVAGNDDILSLGSCVVKGEGKMDFPSLGKINLMGKIGEEDWREFLRKGGSEEN